jgi:hypothetical protein
MLRFALVLPFLAPAIAAAAPVPKPPVLDDALFVGRWDYAYGCCEDGWIVFAADGTYGSAHHPDEAPSWCGLWYVGRDGTLVMLEWSATSSRCWPPVVYRIRLDPRSYPAPCGRTQGGTVVRFSNPRRDP